MAQYMMRLPNPFPKDGFWWGALAGHTLTIRLHTQTGGAVDTGTGVLSLTSDGCQILMRCITIPQSQQAQYQKDWSSKVWSSMASILNEPAQQITLVSSGRMC